MASAGLVFWIVVENGTLGGTLTRDLLRGLGESCVERGAQELGGDLGASTKVLLMLCPGTTDIFPMDTVKPV